MRFKFAGIDFLLRIISRGIKHRIICEQYDIDIKGADGECIGRLESVSVRKSHLKIKGWSEIPSLRLHFFSGSKMTSIVSPAANADEADNVSSRSRYAIVQDLPIADLIEFNSTTAVTNGQKIHVISLIDTLKASAIWTRDLLLTAYRHPGALWKFVLYRDHQSMLLLRSVLFPIIDSENQATAVVPLSSDDFLTGQSPDFDGAAVGILVPIYNAFEATTACLERVVRHTDKSVLVYVINDASTDQRMDPWLENFQASHSDTIRLLNNHENLGFVGTVNRGLKLLEGRHVVLLNSDAMVPKNWLQRLLQPILTDENVASVTPFSNDATICNIPFIDQATDYRRVRVDALDDFAALLNPARSQTKAPTGVGFCMALNAKFLAQNNSFDEIFSPGYGEEVDWCQKAKKIGGKNIVVGNLFVEHRSGDSFGSARKNALIAAHNEIITERHPGYDFAVQELVISDPLASYRQYLALGLLDDCDKIEIFVANSASGGSEMYLEQRITTQRSALNAAIVLRVNPQNKSLKVEVSRDEFSYNFHVESIELLKDAFALLPNRSWIISNVVGAPDVQALLSGLMAVIRSLGDEYRFLIHDYFSICPKFDLVDIQNCYCAVPDISVCNGCLPELVGLRAHDQKAIEPWRRTWGGVLENADVVECFSTSSANIMQKAYPALTNIEVNPHTMPHSVQPIKAPRQSSITQIGILGSIGFNKGAAIVSDLADHAAAHSCAITLIGSIDPEYHRAGLKVTGKYSVNEIGEIATKHKIDCWIIPSIWPETFCYTAHEALATDLPVFCFDLGGQAEAVRSVWGEEMILSPNDFDASDILKQIRSVLLKRTQPDVQSAAPKQTPHT